jgi:hypothetical protein
VTTEPTKRGRGQPTKYRQEYCDRVIEWGKEGKSIEWMCAELGVVYNTLVGSWTRLDPEFAEALELAKLYALKWWEDKGQSGLDTRDFNSNLYSRSMSARFPDKWRESTRNELTGKDGAPLSVPDLTGLSDDQLRLLATIRLKGDEADEGERVN